MTGPSVKIIADSISPDGVRLTSVECVFHRFVLAEVNTHRVFSRNSASSRAIPVERTLARLEDDPWFPIVWASEQPGMSGGEELTGDDLHDAERLLDGIATYALNTIEQYVRSHPNKATRLHKSLLNRPLEWFSGHTALISSTEWENFYRQRCHPTAMPEFRLLSEQIRDSIAKATPTELAWGEWHTPYIGMPGDDTLELIERLQVSVGRCARTSYLTHDGVRDPVKDIELYEGTLAKYGHWSPLEHVAVCLPTRRHGPVQFGRVAITHRGNFGQPWYQMRHLVEEADGRLDRVKDLIAFVEERKVPR